MEEQGGRPPRPANERTTSRLPSCLLLLSPFHSKCTHCKILPLATSEKKKKKAKARLTSSRPPGGPSKPAPLFDRLCGLLKSWKGPEPPTDAQVRSTLLSVLAGDQQKPGLTPPAPGPTKVPLPAFAMKAFVRLPGQGSLPGRTKLCSQGPPPLLCTGRLGKCA